MATNSNFDFKVKVREHVYQVHIRDNREERKRIQKEKYDGWTWSMPDPYNYYIETLEEVPDKSLKHIERAFHYKCPKKELVNYIDDFWKRYEDKIKKEEEKAAQEKAEAERKEQQRLEHEKWLNQTITITNRDMQAILSRLQSLEDRLEDLSSSNVDDVDEIRSRVNSLEYSVYGPGLDE